MISRRLSNGTIAFTEAPTAEGRPPDPAGEEILEVGSPCSYLDRSAGARRGGPTHRSAPTRTAFCDSVLREYGAVISRRRPPSLRRAQRGEDPRPDAMRERKPAGSPLDQSSGAV